LEEKEDSEDNEDERLEERLDNPGDGGADDVGVVVDDRFLEILGKPGRSSASLASIPSATAMMFDPGIW